MSRVRDPMKVGMIYNVGQMGIGHEEARTRTTDNVLCVKHTGDCHYTWARLKEGPGNDDTRYFQLEQVYSAYTIDGVALLNEPQAPSEIISSLLATIGSSRSITVPRKLRVCPHCGGSS